MGRQTLEDIKAQKYFFSRGFKRTSAALLVSLFILAGQVLILAYIKITEPLPAFYATNSAGFITPLTVRYEPNMTSTPLLKSDPNKGSNDKKAVNIS
jgi:hypothetical protein